MKNLKGNVCSQCGTPLTSPMRKFVTTTIIGIGKCLCLDTITPSMVNKQKQPQPSMTAKQRIDALRNAGVDVSGFFAMKDPNGQDYVATNKDGKPVILDDNDPIFNHIINQGTVPNPRLFRRFVMAQMFHMMTHIPYGQKEPLGVTKMIHRLGYEYQWKMLLNELYAQMKMEGKDIESFNDRNRWFNAELVAAMAQDYIQKLRDHVEKLPSKNCKGIPYKRIGGRDIFVSDLHVKLYRPLLIAMNAITKYMNTNGTQLYYATMQFNDLRIKMATDTPQCKEWIDAYKGAGAYFTMQNLIRFHKCLIIDDAENHLDTNNSLAFISLKAEMYKNGDGWRLLALLKKMLEDNNINIKKKMTEWRKKKK